MKTATSGEIIPDGGIIIHLMEEKQRPTVDKKK
jgi:hypothetical protein